MPEERILGGFITNLFDTDLYVGHGLKHTVADTAVSKFVASGTLPLPARFDAPMHKIGTLNTVFELQLPEREPTDQELAEAVAADVHWHNWQQKQRPYSYLIVPRVIAIKAQRYCSYLLPFLIVPAAAETYRWKEQEFSGVARFIPADTLKVDLDRWGVAEKLAKQLSPISYDLAPLPNYEPPFWDVRRGCGTDT